MFSNTAHFSFPWDYTGSVEGIQMILNVVAIFWNGADLINMMISLCMGDLEAAPLASVFVRKCQGKYMRISGGWMMSRRHGCLGKVNVISGENIVHPDTTIKSIEKRLK